jgi:formylglycine-generating enzyme required for sulfatase activity
MGAPAAGTALYAPPEQIGELNHPLGRYSDIYAFGKTCCAMLFRAVQPLPRHWQSLDGKLAALVGKCLEPKPADRYQHFEAILVALGHGTPAPLAGPVVPSKPASPLPSQPAPKPPRPVVRQPVADAVPARPSRPVVLESTEPRPPRAEKPVAKESSAHWLVPVSWGVLICAGGIIALFGLSFLKWPSRSAKTHKNAGVMNTANTGMMNTANTGVTIIPNNFHYQEGPLGMKFVKVPKGTFWMSKEGVNAQVQVTIERDFEMAAYTVTQEQWQAVMGNNQSYFSRQGGGQGKVQDVSDADLKRFPVESVSWNDVQDFLKKLNEQQKDKGWAYRLPSEAEWEYACRGAATSKEECSFDFYLEKATNDLTSAQANFIGGVPAGNGAKGPYLGRPTKAGSYVPNKLGLYDMHGNVWQWTATAEGSYGVVRGGSWNNWGSECRAASRYSGAPEDRLGILGFRLARVPSQG